MTACQRCTKTVYPTEKIDAAGKVFHKACFKCTAPECGITLSLKTFKAHGGEIYCGKHIPQATATAVTDSVSTLHALHAPKKSAEGLKKVQVGTGEQPTYGLESVALQHNVNAPKKTAEGLSTAWRGSAGDGLNASSAAGSQNLVPRQEAQEQQQEQEQEQEQPQEQEYQPQEEQQQYEQQEEVAVQDE